MDFLILNADQQFFFWLLIVPLVLIFSLVIVAIVVRFIKMAQLKNEQMQAIKQQPIDKEQQTEFFEAFGGKDNILEVKKELNRMTVTLADVSKANPEMLKSLGAAAVLIADNHIKVSFKDRTSYVYELIK